MSEEKNGKDVAECTFARRPSSSVIACSLCGTYGGSEDIEPSNATYREKLRELKDYEEHWRASQLAYEAECRAHEATRLELENEQGAHKLACNTIWFQSKRIGELQEQFVLSGKFEIRMIAEAAIGFRRALHCLRRILSEGT